MGEECSISANLHDRIRGKQAVMTKANWNQPLHYTTEFHSVLLHLRDGLSFFSCRCELQSTIPIKHSSRYAHYYPVHKDFTRVINCQFLLHIFVFAIKKRKRRKLQWRLFAFAVPLKGLFPWYQEYYPSKSWSYQNLDESSLVRQSQLLYSGLK